MIKISIFKYKCIAMKTLRKNIDLNSKTVAILQIEATLNDHGALKPFLEKLLTDYAARCVKQRPAMYKTLVDDKLKKRAKLKN